MAALAATRLSLLAPSVPAMSSRASDKNRAKRPRGASAAPRASAEADGEAPYVPGGRIQNACIVITGANRGIGFEFTKQLLAQSPGNRVVAACRDAEGAEKSHEPPARGGSRAPRRHHPGRQRRGQHSLLGLLSRLHPR